MKVSIKCLTSVAIVLCFGSAASAEDQSVQLIVDMKTALASDKPIYDCGCFDKLTRLVKRNWMPPKTQVNYKVVVSFKISESGETTNIRLERSSGMSLSDSAALKAIQNTKLDYVPLEHAKITFNFGFVPSAGTVGPTVVQMLYEPAPPVVYVKSLYESIPGVFHGDCFEHTDLNNQGIVELLKGQKFRAAELFAQASVSNPHYQPAIHNLAIVRQSVQSDTSESVLKAK